MGFDDVWFVLPCANKVQAERTLPEWKSRGYKIAIVQDRFRFRTCADLVIERDKWNGWVAAVNGLCAHPEIRESAVVVTGGDDMYPELSKTAGEMRDEFIERFPGTFGVMQPIGDDMDGTDRICGSPWLGRAFRDLVNGGRGPFWPGYFSYYADEELFNTSRALGCLWQRPEVTHYHDHFTRRGMPTPLYIRASQRKWNHDERVFLFRKALGFPSAEPVGAASRLAKMGAKS